jgi:uncharacterized protein (DUF1697 family)
MRYVALLRAVNVGGAKLPMAQLRDVCAGLGWRGVETYIQSGNVLFEADAPARDLETALEQGVEQHFGLTRPVMVRSAAQWSLYAAGSPFPAQERHHPNHILLGIAKDPVAAGAAEALQARAAAGEQVRQSADALWFWFPDGSGVPKLTPAAIDKAAGSPVTTRNWRTVRKLHELLEPDDVTRR